MVARVPLNTFGDLGEILNGNEKGQELGRKRREFRSSREAFRRFVWIVFSMVAVWGCGGGFLLGGSIPYNSPEGLCHRRKQGWPVIDSQRNPW